MAGKEVLTLAASRGALSPAERAAAANTKLTEALLDPTCRPQQFGVLPEGDATVIVACARRLLVVTPDDALLAGTTVAALAGRWANDLKRAYEREKGALFSATLLRRAIFGLLYPVGLLLAVFLARLLFRRTRERLISYTEDSPGFRLGSVRLLSPGGERLLLTRGLTLIQWAVYILLFYIFLIVLFQNLPLTGRWAGQMFAPLLSLAERLLTESVRLLPRLALAALVVLLIRLALRAVGRIFRQVRAGRIRIDPILSADTA